MPDYIVHGFATYHAYLRVEADSPEEAREAAQALTLSDMDFERGDLFEFDVEESHTPEAV